MQEPSEIPGLEDMIGLRLDSVEFDSDEGEIILMFEGKPMRFFVVEEEDGLTIGIETNREGLN